MTIIPAIVRTHPDLHMYDLYHGRHSGNEIIRLLRTPIYELVSNLTAFAVQAIPDPIKREKGRDKKKFKKKKNSEQRRDTVKDKRIFQPPPKKYT